MDYQICRYYRVRRGLVTGTPSRGGQMVLPWLPNGVAVAVPKLSPKRLKFLVAQTVKNPPVMQETWVRSSGQEDPLEEGIIGKDPDAGKD